MKYQADKGDWVEIHSTILPPGERAPQLPPDTKKVPLVMRAKGFLLQAAKVGEVVDIETCAGRRLSGTLVIVNPAYTHSFGPPLEELIRIGGEVRALLREFRSNQGIAP